MQNLEWLNQNALRAYPLQEDAPRIPRIDGQLVPDMALPNSLLLDLTITLTGTGNECVYLSRVVLAGSFVSLTFSNVDTGKPMLVGTVDTSAYSADANISVPLAEADDTACASGRMVIGNLTRVRESWSDGVYVFDADQTPVEFCVVKGLPQGINGIRVVDGGNVSDLITGEIRLVAGENVRLQYDSVTNTITINAEPGAGYFADCGPCAVENNVVRTINGIPLQDVLLVSGNECIEITESGNEIKIVDKCSTPCCGCEELATATKKLSELDKLTSSIQIYWNKLDSALSL